MTSSSAASTSTSTLAQGSCEPCKASSGISPLSSTDADALLAELNSTADVPGGQWAIQNRPPPHGSIPALERTFLFRNFKHALAFTNAVGEAAEQQGHHPALLTEWGSVKVAWWTHVIGGLHRNDFVMAAKTSQLFADAPGKKKVQS